MDPKLTRKLSQNLHLTIIFLRDLRFDTSDLGVTVETDDLGLVSDMIGLLVPAIFFLSLKDGSILTLDAREEDPSRVSLLTELGLVCVAIKGS